MWRWLDKVDIYSSADGSARAPVGVCGGGLVGVGPTPGGLTLGGGPALSGAGCGGGMPVHFDAVGSTGRALSVRGALKPAGGGFGACWIEDNAPKWALATTEATRAGGGG